VLGSHELIVLNDAFGRHSGQDLPLPEREICYVRTLNLLASEARLVKTPEQARETMQKLSNIIDCDGSDIVDTKNGGKVRDIYADGVASIFQHIFDPLKWAGRTDEMREIVNKRGKNLGATLLENIRGIKFKPLNENGELDNIYTTAGAYFNTMRAKTYQNLAPKAQSNVIEAARQFTPSVAAA